MKTTSTPLWHFMVTYWNGFSWRTLVFNLLVEDKESPSLLAEKYFLASFQEERGIDYQEFWKKNAPPNEEHPFTIDMQRMGQAIKIEEE